MDEKRVTSLDHRDKGYEGYRKRNAAATTAFSDVSGIDKTSSPRERPERSRGVRLRWEDATTDGKRSVLLASKEHFCMKYA